MTGVGFLILFIIVLLESFEIFLEIVNIKYARRIVYGDKRAIPDFLKSDELKRSIDYQWDKIKVGIVESLVSLFFLLVIFITGIIQWYATKIMNYTESEFIRALLFLGSIQLITGLISLPFSLYRQFVVEEKYGFNKMSFSLFFRDLFLGTIIGGIISSILLFVIIKIIEIFPRSWWLIASIFTYIFILFLNYIYPVLIAPLFNRFEPIDDEELIDGIKDLSEKSGFDISEVVKMDASKRSTHSNAYFSGFGKKKRVVLFDTLIDKLSVDELLAVLAHELGHFKMKHILKNLFISFIMILISFLLTYFVINKDFIYLWFGFDKSIFIGLFLVTLLFAPFKFIISPIFMSISRKHEFEADSFAAKLLKGGMTLKSALIKLHKDNLSNPFPHPLYVFLNYSHPPLLERIKRLESYGV
ncbi:M48 family metallopeptidase [Deferribacter autotrophicus]|uniref:M48 family metallopeptidase n=1 Tax=Deferribacter autotrophicus TaxID=500465 RepID=A0A5A8F6Y6_9BACT|nr:M48 family metallopeptidase [Deferribacter autotrophicus]KAA0258639.1 M48 family metallopeptidase [Deferribacter autotrophicus]